METPACVHVNWEETETWQLQQGGSWEPGHETREGKHFSFNLRNSFLIADLRVKGIVSFAEGWKRCCTGL